MTNPPPPTTIAWDARLEAYLAACFGPDRWPATAAALAAPPSSLCVRAADAATADAVAGHAQSCGWTTVRVPGATTVLIRTRQPVTPPPSTLATLPSIIVSRVAAEAMLRGAPGYVAGVLAASAGLEGGMAVAVRAAIEPPGGDRAAHGITRGTALARMDGGGGDDGDDDGGGGVSRSARTRPVAATLAPTLLGVGTARLGRAQLFSSTAAGPAVVLDPPRAPAGEEIVPAGARAMLQHLASTVAAAALAASGHDAVLDLCAAPGGKTTAIAAGLGAGGRVVAIDRSAVKAKRITALAAELGVADRVAAYAADSRFLFDGGGGKKACPGAAASAAAAAARAARKAAFRAALGGGAAGPGTTGPDTASPGSTTGPDTASPGTTGPPAPPPKHVHGCRDAPPADAVRAGSFDRVLLDAPCSGLGLRPRLAQPATCRTLADAAATQKQLLGTAVTALKVGGTLVYSTCSIAPAENEAVVAWALARWPGTLALVPVTLPPGVTASPGLEGAGPAPGGGQEPWLPAGAGRLVARFDPAAKRGDGDVAAGDDTIGFFCAKFVKENNDDNKGTV